MQVHLHRHEHEQLPKMFSPHHHHDHSHEDGCDHPYPLVCPPIPYKVTQLRVKVNNFTRLLREAKVERMKAEREAGLPLS